MFRLGCFAQDLIWFASDADRTGLNLVSPRMLIAQDLNFGSPRMLIAQDLLVSPRMLRTGLNLGSPRMLIAQDLTLGYVYLDLPLTAGLVEI